MNNTVIGQADSLGLKFENHFSKCIKDIIQSTLKLDLISIKAAGSTEKTYPSFVTGVMILKGNQKKDIFMSLTFSKLAAARIVVSLLGTKYNELVEEEVYDSVMEITNMISGRLKTAITTPDVQYQLTTPFVFVGPNHFFAENSRPNGIIRKFYAKKFNMLSGIYFI